MRQTGWREPLGLEVPERAVERIARAAGRQQAAERFAVDARLDVAAHVLDRGAHALGVVAEVVDARGFAFAGRAALARRATTTTVMSVNVYPVIVNGADSGISSRATESCISSSC